VTAAPMALPGPYEIGVLDWLPSASGLEQTRLVLHEYLGLLAGA